MASKASYQKIYQIREVITNANSDQVVANTLANLLYVKRAISKNSLAQLLMLTTGEDL